MDEILAKASNQAVSFAIRSGISIASGYAIKTMTKFIDRIPDSEKARLIQKRNSLQRKISALVASLDLIKLASARGNSILDHSVDLASGLREDLDQFDESITKLEQGLNQSNQKESITSMERKIDSLSSLINEAIPIINLSLITSGVNLSNVMEPRISPSRLLQAANRINASNIAFGRNGGSKNVRVGPVFELKFFSVFYNPSRLKYIDESSSVVSTNPGSIEADESLDSMNAVSWKEEFAKANCSLVRVAGGADSADSAESVATFNYHLLIEESFDDGRYHDDDEEPQVRKIAIDAIEKQYFSASGKLLRLESSDLPVMVLKISQEGKTEYIALGETGDDGETSDDLSDLENETTPTEGAIQTLSLLEYLMRLCALQSSEGCTIFEMSDEKLLVYLQDQVDKSILPKSREDRRKEAVKESETKQMLQNDSNMNRLSKLSLDDRRSK